MISTLVMLAVVTGSLTTEIGAFTTRVTPTFYSLATPLMTNTAVKLDADRQAVVSGDTFTSYCVGGLYRVDFGAVKSELIVVPLRDTNVYQYAAMRDNATNIAFAGVNLVSTPQTNISYTEVTNSPWINFISSNAAPSGYSVSTSTPAIWMPVTNGTTRYVVPAYVP